MRNRADRSQRNGIRANPHDPMEATMVVKFNARKVAWGIAAVVVIAAAVWLARRDRKPFAPGW